MPTYEYACTSCGHHLEVSQSFSDAPLTTCPNCGGDLRKVFGSIGIVLKGSGFYRTDSRSGASGKSAPKDAPSKDTGSKDKEKKATVSKGAGSESAAPTSASSTSADTSSSSGSANATKAAASAG